MILEQSPGFSDLHLCFWAYIVNDGKQQSEKLRCLEEALAFGMKFNPAYRSEMAHIMCGNDNSIMPTSNIQATYSHQHVQLTRFTYTPHHRSPRKHSCCPESS